MAQQVGNSELLRTWANDGTVVVPSNAKIDEGWLRGEQPPHEWMNYIHNVLGQKVNHMLSRGAPDWNDGTEYGAGALVNHNGLAWVAQAANDDSEPSSANADWAQVLDLSDLENVRSGLEIYQNGLRASVGGTADAISLTLGLGLAAPPEGLKIRFRAGAPNTGAVTIALDGGGAIDCRTITGVALPDGYIRDDVDTEAVYDGTNWIVDRQPEIGAVGNQWFERYATGHQMCVGFASGGDTVVFPAEFLDTGGVIRPRPIVTPAGDDPRMASASERTGTGFDLNVFDENGNPETTLCRYVAHGFWYDPT